MSTSSSRRGDALTAAEVKALVRRRYPATQPMGYRTIPGPWTVIEEWRGIDVIAIGATGGAGRYAWIGHEVKVSRSDLRRELLRPDKREAYKAFCHELFFAVPKNLLTADEIAYDEPKWSAGDFQREPCPGVPHTGRWGGKCAKVRGQRARQVTVPIPGPPSEWGSPAQAHIECPTCEGKGYLAVSRVEREAPTCWVPRDVGLIEVTRGGCRVVKAAPRRHLDEHHLTLREVNDLVRWVSARPDPRHEGVVEGARATGREIAALVRGKAA